MTNRNINALTVATTPLAGTETLPIWDGATKKVATNDLTVCNVRANATTGIMQITGPAAASTRVATVPDANWTAARTDAAQSFSGRQTFDTGIFVDGGSANTANGLSVWFDTNTNTVNFKGFQAGVDWRPFLINGYSHTWQVSDTNTFQLTTARNAKIMIAGNGYDFSANTPAAGMTSQLLNWYEEGTWTPANSSGSATFTTNFARYTRIGRMVHIQLYISINTNSDSANIGISGLPYTCATNGWAPSIINTNAAQTALMRVASGSATLNAYTVSAETAIPWMAFSGKYIVTQITYSI